MNAEKAIEIINNAHAYSVKDYNAAVESVKKAFTHADQHLRNIKVEGEGVILYESRND